MCFSSRAPKVAKRGMWPFNTQPTSMVMLDTNVLWSSTVGRTFLTLITLGSGRNGWSNKPEESSQSQSAYIHIEIMQFTNLSIICISCGLTCLSVFSPPIWKVGKVWVAFVTFFSLCKAVPILMCTWPCFYNVIPVWVTSKSKEWVFQSPSAFRPVYFVCVDSKTSETWWMLLVPPWQEMNHYITVVLMRSIPDLETWFDGNLILFVCYKSSSTPLVKHWYNSIKSTRSSDWHDLRIHQNIHMHT